MTFIVSHDPHGYKLASHFWSTSYSGETMMLSEEKLALMKEY